MSSVKEEMLVFRARMMQELKGVLTPEQMEKLDRMKIKKWARKRDQAREWGQRDSD